MTEYTSEIKSVNCRGKRIGFIARRSAIFGFAQDIEDTWCATTNIIAPEWITSFANRKEARLYLVGKQEV